MAERSDRPPGEVLTVPADYIPRRRQDVLEIDMGDGVILFDHESGLVHHLNPSAAVIWRLCDGSESVEELIHDMANEFGLDEPGVRGEIAGLIAELEALGLVVEARPMLEEQLR